MDKFKMISVIIPIFNEEGNIRKLFSDLKENLLALDIPFEILYVNDGSSDNSAAIIKEICKQESVVCLISLSRNFGQDAAMTAGLREARGEAAIIMDGDLQDDPRDIKNLLDEIMNGCDIACGWRRNRAKRNILRDVEAFLGNRFGRIIFGLPINDFNATFKVYTRSAIERLYFFQGFHRFVPVLALINNLHTKEVEIRNNPRYSGFSKYHRADLRRISAVVKYALFLWYVIKFRKKIEWVLPEVKYEISERYVVGEQCNVSH